MISAGADMTLMVALVVIAIVVGKPLSYLNCNSVGSSDGGSAYALTSVLMSNLNKEGGKIGYSTWIGASKTNCLETKSIWGLIISLWYVYV